MCWKSRSVSRQPRIVRHDRARHHRARILQMVAVPVVGILAADAGEIGTGALAAPLERLVVHALGRERIMAVALDLVAQRADHLRMAEVAAFAHIDVAAGELERRIGPHAVDLLDRVLQVEQRHDLDEAADRDHDQDADHKDDRVLLEDCVSLPERHGRPRLFRRRQREAGRRGGDRRVHGFPEIAGHQQRAGEEQRAAERADDVEGMHRLHRLDEGIFEEAELV